MQEKFMGLNLCRKILAILIIISIGYVASSIFIKKESFFEKRIPQASHHSGILKTPFQKEKKDYTLFLKKVEKRKVFVSSQVEETPSTSKVNREELNKIISRLRLVGIISGEPRKAIIEDRMSRKSFYLQEGEEIMENIKVEKIEKRFVILNYYGEKFGLYL